TRDLALAVNILAGGLDVAKYNDLPGDGHRYDIRLKGRDGEFRQSSDLGKIFLRNREGQLVRLDTVASIEESIGAAVIGRNSLQYAANFFSAPAVPLADAIGIVQEYADQVLPLGYTVSFQG